MKIYRKFQKGILPFYETGLAEMIHHNVNDGRLSFTTSVSHGVGQSEIVFIAIGIQQKQNGRAGLNALKRISWEIAESMQRYTVVVEKSYC
jgi:UDPglucose 6-dehydrogenase